MLFKSNPFLKTTKNSHSQKTILVLILKLDYFRSMKITRQDLIKWIKAHDLFYQDVNFETHDYERLLKIYMEVQGLKKVREQLHRNQ